jgi:hypothetical protein
MVQACGRLSFSGETPAAIFVLAEMRGKEFEGYFSIQLGVESKVNLTHATRADLLKNLVV